MSHKKVKYDSKGNGEEYWEPKPKWIDKNDKTKVKNNSELIANMQAELTKYSKGAINNEC